jgi:hypothetical protein
LRCSNIDQDLVKVERDEREEGEGGREKEKRANTHAHPPTICVLLFKDNN